MIQLTPLEQTVAGQELIMMGRIEGRTEGFERGIEKGQDYRQNSSCTAPYETQDYA